MLCIVCYKRDAELPDRNTMSPRKRVCKECHRDRLTGDLRNILNHRDAADPVCEACKHPRSEHEEEQPYLCYCQGFCECPGFSYVLM